MATTDIFSDLPGVHVPLTGELVAFDDADGLIDAYERVKAAEANLWACKRQLAESLYKLCKGDETTQRVMGKRRRVKVVAPDVTWNQSKLKQLWEAFPDWRLMAMRIGTLDINKRGLDMLLRTNGDENLEMYKARIREACNGPTGSPKLTIEV